MSSLKRHTLVGALLCALGFLAYGGSLNNGFVWDDNFQIVRNPYVHGNYPVVRLFTSDVWGYIRGGQVGLSNYYRPLQMLTYRLVADVFGLTPWVFHLSSILLNVLAGIAAYLVLWQLTRSRGVAIASGVLFLLHPIHSEAVYWIAASTELGCAFFYFLAFWCFLLAEEAREARVEGKSARKEETLLHARSVRARNLTIASSVLFLVALLWKEMALTLPVLIAAYVFLSAREEPWKTALRRAALQSLPYWCVVAVYAAIRVAVLGYFSKTQHFWQLTKWQFAINIVGLVGEYWWKLVAPLHLNAFHVFHPAMTIGDERVLMSIAFLGAALATIVFLRKRQPLAAFATTWVFLTLAPVLNLPGVGQNVFTERYLYIPSLGFVLLLCGASAAMLQRAEPKVRQVVAVSLVAVVSVSAIADIRLRGRDWADDRALFTSTVAASPESAQMHNSLAQIRRDDDHDLVSAQREYQIAVKLALDQGDKLQAANAYLGLAGLASRIGKYDVGLQLIDEGLAQEPQLPSLHTGKGILLMQSGRLDEARQVLEEAHKYFPYDEVVLNALGAIALTRKQYPEAIERFQAAVAAAPTYADGYNNLGRAYGESGDLPRSIAAFEKAVDIAPTNPQFLTNFGVALARQGRFPEAQRELQRALDIAPSYSPAASAMANLRNVMR